MTFKALLLTGAPQGGGGNGAGGWLHQDREGLGWCWGIWRAHELDRLTCQLGGSSPPQSLECAFSLAAPPPPQMLDIALGQ